MRDRRRAEPPLPPRTWAPGHAAALASLAPVASAATREEKTRARAASASASRERAQQRAQERRGTLGRLRVAVASIIRQVAFMTVVVTGGVLLYTAFVVFAVPGSDSSPSFATAWTQIRGVLPTCAVGVLAAAVLHDLWVEFRTRALDRSWARRSGLHFRALLLTLAGLGVLIGLEYSGGSNAPGSTGRWVLIAVAAAQGTWLVGLLAAEEFAPGVRSSGRALATLLGAGVGVAIAANGLSADTEAAVAEHREDTDRLKAAVGFPCNSARRWNREQPRAWQRAEVVCRATVVRVRYVWLPDGVLNSYSARRTKVLGDALSGSGSRCSEGGYEGHWFNKADPDRKLGRLRCFARGSEAYLEWSNDESSFYAIARRRGKISSLYRWWRRMVQPSP